MSRMKVKAVEPLGLHSTPNHLCLPCQGPPTYYKLSLCFLPEMHHGVLIPQAVGFDGLS